MNQKGYNCGIHFSTVFLPYFNPIQVIILPDIKSDDIKLTFEKTFFRKNRYPLRMVHHNSKIRYSKNKIL